MCLSSKKACEVIFDVAHLQKLTRPRLKALKGKVYRYTGRFYCCEYRCFLELNTPQKKLQHATLHTNIKNINDAMATK